MKLVLFTLFFFISQNVFASNKENILQALELVSKDKISEAYEKFDQIPVDSSEYSVALLEMQKIHYKLGEWDKFFGFATYYRNQRMSQFFIPELLLLESMALIKHCQLELANKILDQTKKILSKNINPSITNKSSREKIQAVEDLLFLQMKMPGNIQTLSKDHWMRIFSHTQEWKISNQSREKIASHVVKNPRALRVYVRNICQKVSAPDASSEIKEESKKNEPH